MRSKHEVTQKVGSVMTKSIKSVQVLFKLAEISMKFESWTKSQDVLARLLRACCDKGNNRRELILTTPEPRDLQRARQVQFWASMSLTLEAIRQGK